MLGKFIRKLLGSALESESTAEGVRQDESMEALREEFDRTFCHQPGVNFMDFLRSQGVTRLIDWLHSADPLAQSFIRLNVDGLRKGHKVWEKQGVSLMFEGNWDLGGLPGQESRDALSVLAQTVGKPIKVFYTEKPNGPFMVLEFQP